MNKYYFEGQSKKLEEDLPKRKDELQIDDGSEKSSDGGAEAESETQLKSETQSENETQPESETQSEGAGEETGENLSGALSGETQTESVTGSTAGEGGETGETVAGSAMESTEATEVPESTTETAEWWKFWEDGGISIGWVAGGVLAAVLAVLGVFAFLRVRRKKKMVQREQPRIPKKAEVQNTPPVQTSNRLGKVHNIGSRNEQQDSFGVTDFAGGKFIVVADGMGGLSSGDKVSQMIVMTMLQDVSALRNVPDAQVLYGLVSHANSEVNRMIGNSDRYTSGSTVVAAIVEKDCFHWVSVGDSRIYLYRNGRLIQLNREHTYGAELLIQAVNGEVSFEEAQSHPKRGGLTSFIGMGELKYVDGSVKGIKIQQGDRLLLMSDGIFHTLSEEEMQYILETSGCAENVAKVMQDRILAYGKVKQDNFTAVILDL